MMKYFIHPLSQSTFAALMLLQECCFVVLLTICVRAYACICFSFLIVFGPALVFLDRLEEEKKKKNEGRKNRSFF